MWLVLALGVVGSAVGAAAARLGVGNVVCQTLHGELMPGDGQPFGCHADPVGDITEIPEGVVPHPRDFFETFVRTREPAVLRGAVKLAGGVEGWTDDRLAGPEFGGLQIKLEGKREKREETQGALLGKLAMGRDTLGHFVNRTRRNSSLAERKLGGPLPDNETTVRPVQVGHVFESTRSQLEGYVVSQLPAPMSPDVHVPAVATCGSMATELLEANLWVSSGNTSSMLHRDADNVFNCVYKGSKVWTLVDPLETPRIPQAAEKVGEIGGVALVDPDRIDASTPQGLQLLDEGGVPYRRVTANAGDCVFLPWGYWHQVYSPPGRNIAVTLLYSVAHRFDDPDGECEPPPTPSVPAAAPTSASVDPSGASTIEPGGSAPSPPPPPLPIHGPMGPTRLRLAPWLEPLPLSEASIVWSYDGQGEMSMGNADPASFRLQTAMTAQLPRSAADLPARTGLAEAERLLADARLARSIAERVAAERGISAPSPADAYGESEDEMEGDGDGWEQAGLLADRAAAGSLDDEDDEDEDEDEEDDEEEDDEEEADDDEDAKLPLARRIALAGARRVLPLLLAGARLAGSERRSPPADVLARARRRAALLVTVMAPPDCPVALDAQLPAAKKLRSLSRHNSTDGATMLVDAMAAGTVSPADLLAALDSDLTVVPCVEPPRIEAFLVASGWLGASAADGAAPESGSPLASTGLSERASLSLFVAERANGKAFAARAVRLLVAGPTAALGLERCSVWAEEEAALSPEQASGGVAVTALGAAAERRLNQFVRSFRQHFKDRMQPKALQRNWSVDYPAVLDKGGR
uniref:JmjC domain-containing protein n=1 Tax=Cafeteria roenbergensis TaxID=33653 RepID=A0A7S0PCL6_CAFRO|mmetsp:Transcript_2349/g.9198  ORF Transcript_2349/g.9198 Transcript_2349/m.9198 type:complete len:808 (+) Transcript_2349:47-2470(+)